MKGRARIEGRKAHGRPVLPGSSQAPATPFIKHKNILLALAQGVLGRQEGGIGPGEVWWPFQLVPQEVCKQAPEASGNSFPISNRENRFTGLYVWEEHHGCWDVNPENTGQDL